MHMDKVSTGKEKNFISAVIYIHNAADRIERFLQMVIQVLETHFEHSEIICVNDCSEDESVARIRRMGKTVSTTSLTILHMSYFHGLETAMNAGLDLAIGDFVFEFDSTVPDYESREIMRVYGRALDGYDIVSASADRKQRFSSALFYRVFERYANLSDSMRTESFRILSRRVINRIGSMNTAVPYRKAVYANCGLKTDHLVYQGLPVTALTDRKEQKKRKHLAVDALILFTDVGYRFSISMTVAMMLIAIFMILYSVTTYLISKPVEGWTTTILFLSVAFFGLFGILTIVIKYLQLLVELVFRRKRYSFESIEKLTK